MLRNRSAFLRLIPYGAMAFGLVLSACDSKEEAKKPDDSKPTAAAKAAAPKKKFEGNPATRPTIPRDPLAPEMAVLNTANRKVMSDTLTGMEKISDKSLMHLQEVIYRYGVRLLGAFREPLTREQVVAAVASHQATPEGIKFTFKNGGTLLFGPNNADIRIGNNQFGTLIEKMPGPVGRLRDDQLEDFYRYLSGRFSLPVNDAQKAELDRRLTTPGLLFDPKEQVMEREPDLYTYATKNDDGSIRIELFNGEILQLAKDGNVQLEWVPW